MVHVPRASAALAGGIGASNQQTRVDAGPYTPCIASMVRHGGPAAAAVEAAMVGARSARAPHLLAKRFAGPEEAHRSVVRGNPAGLRERLDARLLEVHATQSVGVFGFQRVQQAADERILEDVLGDVARAHAPIEEREELAMVFDQRPHHCGRSRLQGLVRRDRIIRLRARLPLSTRIEDPGRDWRMPSGAALTSAPHPSAGAHDASRLLRAHLDSISFRTRLRPSDSK